MGKKSRFSRAAFVGMPEAKGVSWEALLGRALSGLDKQGEEDLEGARSKAAWRKERNERKGFRVEIDFEGVKRSLAEYYEGCVGRRPFRGFKKVFADNGVLMADYFDGLLLEPELHVVFKYIQKHRDETTRSAAMDLGRQAQESQERLVTEEDCRLNQRAVEVSLKATMKDLYGDGDSAGGEASGKRQVVYNMPNLTVNMITAPAGLLGAAKEVAAVDAEVVSDGS